MSSPSKAPRVQIARHPLEGLKGYFADHHHVQYGNDQYSIEGLGEMGGHQKNHIIHRKRGKRQPPRDESDRDEDERDKDERDKSDPEDKRYESTMESQYSDCFLSTISGNYRSRRLSKEEVEKRALRKLFRSKKTFDLGPCKKDPDDAAVRDFNEQWLREHPKYNLLDADCQTYTHEWADFFGADMDEAPWRNLEAFRIRTWGQPESLLPYQMD